MSRTFPLGQIVAAPYTEHGETQFYRARVDSYDQQKRQERRIDTATVSINQNSEFFLYHTMFLLFLLIFQQNHSLIAGIFC